MPDDDLPRPDVVVGISWPGRTAEEADILDMVARDNGREWTERRADSILDQARAIGQL